MQKFPRRSTFNGGNILKGVIFFEIVVFAGSLLVWSRMNKSRDFRKSVQENFPAALDIYYRIGETFDSTNTCRDQDSSIWDRENSRKK